MTGAGSVDDEEAENDDESHTKEDGPVVEVLTESKLSHNLQRRLLRWKSVLA